MPLSTTVTSPGVLGSDCPPMVLRLLEFACTNPETKRTKLAALGRNGFFNSPLVDGFRDLQPEIVGDKVKSVRLQVLARECIDNLDDCSTLDPCAKGETDPYTEVTVDFDPVCSAKKITFSPQEFERVCGETPDDGLLRRINRVLDALNQDHETKILAQVLAGSGGNVVGPVAPGGYAQLSSELINSDGLINANGIHSLTEQLMENEADDCTPIAIGGYQTPLQKMSTIQRIGCCNDKGVDQQAAANELGGIAYFSAKSVQRAFTLAGAPNPAKAVALIHPGSVHLVEYLSFENNPFEHGESFGRVYVDPLTGIRYDMHVTFDDCNICYNITFSKQSMAWTMPVDLYQACDELSGVNGIWLYDLAECPPATC